MTTNGGASNEWFIVIAELPTFVWTVERVLFMILLLLTNMSLLLCWHVFCCFAPLLYTIIM
jgi:hypothetical protein